MVGWLRIHRTLMNKAIWLESTPEQKVVLMTLLMMADWQPSEWEWKGKKYITQPGQFITSLDSIVRNCGKGISVQNVRTAINRFERYGFLTNESTNVNRLITIVNWEFYQRDDNEPNKATNIVSNKQLTSNQQSTNKQLTTNKNIINKELKESNKEDLKDSESSTDNSSPKGISLKRFVPPTLEEVQAYCLERKNGIDAESFIAFYTSKGWKVGNVSMKDWKSAVITWEKRDKKTNSTKPTKAQIQTAKSDGGKAVSPERLNELAALAERLEAKQQVSATDDKYWR